MNKEQNTENKDLTANFGNTMLYDVDGIVNLLPFSDNEIGTLQYFFKKYIEQNSKELTKEDCFILGLYSANFQYQFRVLKERITNNVYKNDDNNYFFQKLSEYKGLFEFLRIELISYYERMSDFSKYNYMQNTFYSFFHATDNVKDEIKSDGLKFFNNIV